MKQLMVAAMPVSGPVKHVIRRGLDLPISTVVSETFEHCESVKRVAVMPSDWVDVKPKMLVAPGDSVMCGQPLFEDRRNPGVVFTSPAGGVVAAVNRAERREIESIVVEIAAEEKFVTFSSFRGPDLVASASEIRALLVESGMWPSLKMRPFGTVPAIDAAPTPIFVTAIDTYPLAPLPSAVIARRAAEFVAGLKTLVTLAEGQPVFLCVRDGDAATSALAAGLDGVETHSFAGPHPAGLPGTHIHLIRPASVERPVWHIGYQDVIAVGHLARTGTVMVERVVGVSGPAVTTPALFVTRVGAEIAHLVSGRLAAGEIRTVSGSVIFGRAVNGGDSPDSGFVGYFDNQINAIAEDRSRSFLGWMAPGGDRFSVLRVFLSGLFRLVLPNRKYPFNTSTNGSRRAVMPFGVFEKITPLDIMATHMARSLMVSDIEYAMQLGVLELDEQDVALWTLTCPGKNDYGPALRHVLDTIRKEG